MDTVKRTGARTIGRALLCAVLGLVVGAVGTVMHRVVVTDHLLPAGIVVALLAVLTGGVLARAWTGYAGLAGYALGWVVAVQVLASQGPGGDLLVPNQTVGLVWVYGGMAVVAITAFLPWSWFSDQPVRGRSAAVAHEPTDTGSSRRTPVRRPGADA